MRYNRGEGDEIISDGVNSLEISEESVHPSHQATSGVSGE